MTFYCNFISRKISYAIPHIARDKKTTRNKTFVYNFLLIIKQNNRDVIIASVFVLNKFW